MTQLSPYTFVNAEVPLPSTVPVVTPVYYKVVNPTPPSIAAQDWTSFDAFTTRVFTSDFCHNQHITFNARIPSAKEGYVKVRQQLRYEHNNLEIRDQLRVWFPMSWRRGSFIYSHKLDDKIRIQYDHGYYQNGEYTLNPYASLDFLTNWTGINGRFGVSHTGKRVFTNTRVRVDKDKTTTLYHKTQLKFKEWKLGFQGVVDLSKKSLLKKDLVIGYERDNVRVYLKGEQAWNKPTKDYNQWRQFFSSYVLTALYNRNLKELYGVQVISDPSANTIKQVAGLVEYQHKSNARVKVKLNQDLLFTLLMERKVNAQLTASLGLQMHLRTDGEKTKPKTGLKISWNL